MSIIHPTMTMRCGDDWFFIGPINDSNGNPLPLTGSTITWKLDSLDMTTNLITGTITSGLIVITNYNTATIEYGPLAAVTATIPPGSYYDTVYVALAGGAWSGTVIEGQINATPSAT